MSAAEVLARARAAGIGLRLEADGRVIVAARPSTVPPELLAELRERRDDVARLLAAERVRLGRADLAAILEGFPGATVEFRPATPVPPVAPASPPRPPSWPSVDRLREAYGDAHGGEAKRATVRGWAEAAGGLVEGDTVRLPGGCKGEEALAVATLRTYARCVGLAVGEPCERPPSWLPDVPPSPPELPWVWQRPLPPRRTKARETPRLAGPDPMACRHCGEACDPRDLEAGRLPDGTWEHLGCWLDDRRAKGG